MQVARILRPLASKNRHVFFVQRNYAKRKKKESKFPQVTLNDMPQPEGDFYAETSKRQKSYTLHLVVGIGFFAFSVAFGAAFDLYQFHDDIPDEMPEVECYKQG